MGTMVCSRCGRTGMYWSGLSGLFPRTVCPHCQSPEPPIFDEDSEIEDEDSEIESGDNEAALPDEEPTVAASRKVKESK